MKKILVMLRDSLRCRTILFTVITIIILALSGYAADQVTYKRVSPYQEIYDAGLLKYVGSPLVQPSSVNTAVFFPRIDVYNFSSSRPGRGPLCLGGSEFFVETRDGSNSQLLIFLQMGGVCLNEICAATAEPLVCLRTMTIGNLIDVGGILNRFDPRNPMANYNVVHIPYCDGALFMGDVDRVLSYKGTSVDDAQPAMAYQRGLQNLTAGLEVAKRRYPHPSRIVLAGSSGGSYGIMPGLALARYYYPNTEIVVIADSGAPMGRDEDKDFIRRALTELNAIQYVPLKSCPDCIANGHVTKIVDWALHRDPNFRIASMSHADDAVIGTFYMQSPPPIFRDALLRESASLANWGSRVHRFITPGTEHTYLLDMWIPDLFQEVIAGAFGTLVFTGDSINSTMMSGWSLGNLSNTATDKSGKKVTGYQWLTNLLKNPYTLQDVVEVE